MQLRLPFYSICRRAWIGFLYLAFLAAFESSARQPNIVFILADDLGWHQLGCYGSDFYETPRLDRMANEGMRYTDAYAAAPVCSPTRGSIMTGKYPARTHLTVNIPTDRNSGKPTITPEFAEWLPVDEVTVAEILKSAGYVTGHFGKWHLNKDKDYRIDRPGDPRSQGFDAVLTTHKAGKGPSSPFPEDPLHVKQITLQALDFIEDNRDKPFFCYLSHNSIHRPEVADEATVARFRSEPNADNDVEYGHNNPKQAAMLAQLDESVGLVLDRLDEWGLSENTVVVFFSDNGHLGPKDKGPLRGSKADLYEGGIRSPMIVRWSGKVPEDTICREMVISNDFFTTFGKLAGVNRLPDNIDGLDLSAVFEDPKTPLKRDSLFFHFPHYHLQGLGPVGAVREGRYKLIEWYEKALLNEPGAYELYDLNVDLAERNDLSAQHPELTLRLKGKLREWRRSIGAQEMRLNDSVEAKPDGCIQ